MGRRPTYRHEKSVRGLAAAGRSDAGSTCPTILPRATQQLFALALGATVVAIPVVVGGLDPVVAATVAYGGALSALAGSGSGLW